MVMLYPFLLIHSFLLSTDLVVKAQVPETRNTHVPVSVAYGTGNGSGMLYNENDTKTTHRCVSLRLRKSSHS